MMHSPFWEPYFTVRRDAAIEKQLKPTRKGKSSFNGSNSHWMWWSQACNFLQEIPICQARDEQSITHLAARAAVHRISLTMSGGSADKEKCSRKVWFHSRWVISRENTKRRWAQRHGWPHWRQGTTVTGIGSFLEDCSQTRSTQHPGFPGDSPEHNQGWNLISNQQTCFLVWTASTQFAETELNVNQSRNTV